MPRPNQSKRAQLINGGLVALVAAVTLATSPVDDGQTTGSSDTREEWSSDRQAFELNVLPMADRIDSFNYSGELYLAVNIGFVPDELVSAPRWSVQLKEGDGVFERTGDFAYAGGEIQTQDNGTMHRFIRGTVGRLCHQGESSDDGCVPCAVETGCSLTVEIERCTPALSGFMMAIVEISRDTGAIFELTCFDGDGTKPICHGLDDWLEMDLAAPTQGQSLCGP